MARPTAVKKLFKAPDDVKGAKKRKWRAHTVAKRDIVKQQRRVDPLITKTAIRQSVIATAHSLGKSDIRFKKKAVEALREAASTFLVDFFTAANKVRVTENKNVTLQKYHTQIGRTTMNVDCMSEVSIPMIQPVHREVKQTEPVEE